MMNRLLILLLLIGSVTFGQTPATPWAEGHGQFTTGGRGHGLFFVTNTSNSGAGSFRQALADAASAGGGNIIFRTGGTITISSDLSISGNNITIWGESAPGGGIAVYGRGTIVTGQNFIMTNLRFRAGDPANELGLDSFGIYNTSGSATKENYFIDHCSFSWASDENFSIATGVGGVTAISEVTVQNSIISESFDSRNVLLWGRNITDISFLNNYMANTQQRNIACTSINNSFEQINNFIYGYYIGVELVNKNVIDVVNNVFEEGYTTALSYSIGYATCSSSNCPPSGDTSFTGSALYHTGNTKNGSSITTTSNINPYITGSRNVSSGYSPRPTNEVKAYVLANAGARAWVDNVDALDAHVLADGANGSTGSWPSNESQTTGLPSLSAGTPYTDSDNDGMADSWEIANFGDLSKTYNGTDLGGGYTNLEYFMFSLSGWYPDGPDPDPGSDTNYRHKQKKAAATNILNW